MAATTTLAQGSSVTLTVVATDTLLIDGARSASAIVEAVTGVPGAANRQRIVNHPGGQATYGPFGAGTVQLSAIGGAIAYAQGAATLDDEPQDVKYNQTSQSLVSGDGEWPLHKKKVNSFLGVEVCDLVTRSTLVAGASFSGSGSYNSAGVLAVQSTGTITHNPTGWYDGTPCLDFVPNTDTDAEFRIYLGASPNSINISDDDGIAFEYGLPEVDTSKTNFNIRFEFSSDASSLFPTNKSLMSIWRCDSTTATGKEKAGQKYVRQRWDHDATDANAGAWPGYGISTSGTGADRTANVTWIRFICTKMSGKTIKFKRVLRGGHSTPCVVMGTDAITPETVASLAQAYMARKGLGGYLNNYTGGITTYLDTARRMYAAGCEINGNDVADRPLGVDVTDEATMRSAVETTKETLRGYGFTRGSKVWVSNNNSSSYLMIRELERAGYVANRNGAADGRYIFPEGGVPDAFRLPAYPLDNLNATAVQPIIDRAILMGCTIWFYWHSVLSSAKLDADRTANVTGTSGAPIARSGTETLIAYRARAAGLGTAAGTASVVYFDARIGSAGTGVWWEELKTTLDYCVTKIAAGDLVAATPEEWCRDVGLL